MYIRIDADEGARRRYGRPVEDLTESEAREFAAWLASEAAGLLSQYRYIRIRTESEYFADLLMRKLRRAVCKGGYACQHSMYFREDGAIVRPATLAGILTSALVNDVSIDIRDVIGFLKIAGAQAVEVVTPAVYRVLLRIEVERKRNAVAVY